MEGGKKERGFEVLTAVKMLMLFFWVVTPHGLVGRYQCFGGRYCLCVHGYKSTLHYPEDQHQQIIIGLFTALVILVKDPCFIKSPQVSVLDLIPV
jgi:hypothetical protein